MAGVESCVRLANDSRASIYAASARYGGKIGTIVQNCGIFESSENARPRREISTRAVIAENNVPHATTWRRPELEVAGRRDILSGYAQSACNRDPVISDSTIKVTHNRRDIANARNAAISADANNDARTMISRQSVDRFLIHFLSGRRPN